MTAGAEPTLADAGFVELAHDPVRLEQAARLAFVPRRRSRRARPRAPPRALALGALPPRGADRGAGRRRPPTSTRRDGRVPAAHVGRRARARHPAAAHRRRRRARVAHREGRRQGGRCRTLLAGDRRAHDRAGGRATHRGGTGPRVPHHGRAPPIGPDADAAPDDEWVEERVADPKLLFRFSAVTANAHRIHYDHPYATEVEGYPDLVVHGPLTAILLAELARTRRGQDAHEVSYRAVPRTSPTAASGLRDHLP